MISQTHTIPSLSGTFGIPTRLALYPKMPKEPSSPSRSNARTERHCVNYETNRQRNNKGQRTTSYIKHLAVSGLSSVSARIKSSCNLTGKCFEMPNVSYT
jgi:hypothetical protein